ncbi:MAG: helix-turn-helix domain-containing protein [Nocardiopsaceae bacterium]|nr:helix-turn-helix domain-containing protein [Nocardiopsaceae bacterium]
MTIGEALAGARARAGLSVDEVSERTKIREMVIRDIERDDYGACGGDLYVRGYVRAIANAVGIDPQPLFREYESSAAASQPGRASQPGCGSQPGRGSEPGHESQPGRDLVPLRLQPGPPRPRPSLARRVWWRIRWS